jgi:four helix bundle protein
MTIKRFEELDIWQNARELCKKIRRTAETTSLGKDFSLKDQIFRSSGSVMDNIACPVK